MAIQDARQATQSALDRLDELTSSGWSLTRHIARGDIAKKGTPRDLIADLASVSDILVGASLTADFAGAKLSYMVTANGTTTLVNGSSGDLSEHFGVDDIDDARLAWAGNVEAAFRLPGEWACLGTLEWTKVLEVEDPGHQWLVFWDQREVENYLKAQPYWRFESAVDLERGTVALVRDLAQADTVVTPVLTVASLAATDLALPTPPAPAEPGYGGSVFAGAVEPTWIMPTTHTGDVDRLVEALTGIAVAGCWARIATSTEVAPDNSHVVAEYFGLQRTRHQISATGPTVSLATARESIALLEWVESAGTVDRLLAVRQIVSLKTGAAPWDYVKDIQSAAEPIFMALRSDAVAEALRALRDARTSALDAARRSIETSTSIAKSTAERALAALIAIGGVILAKSTTSVGADQADDLRSLIAYGLFGLAAWNLAVERPTLFRAIADFQADLPTLSELLLPPADNERVRNLVSLTNARNQALRVAWAVPLLYIFLGVVALLITG